MSTYSEQIRFCPWIGAKYGADSRWRLPLLILGESHYDRGERPVTRNFTKELTEDYASGDFNHIYWTNITTALLGEKASAKNRYDLWHSLAFYNYVQEIVGDNPGQRPTDAMWNKSKEPLNEVLTTLKPKCILVVCKDLWSHLDVDTYPNGIIEANGKKIPTGMIGATFSGVVPHVSRGFSALSWHPVIMRFIAKAMN